MNVILSDKAKQELEKSTIKNFRIDVISHG